MNYKSLVPIEEGSIFKQVIETHPKNTLAINS